MANEYTTYSQVGQAEDVSDIITNISPTDVPFQTMCRKGKADARLIEWQEDSLRAAATNAVVEGADATNVARVATTMRSNYTQILQDTMAISDTADRIRLYGRKTETAYQLVKAGKQLKRDLEHTLVGTSQNAAVGDASSNPRYMGNLFGQDAAGSPVDMVNSAVESSNGGTPRKLTETILLSVHEDLFDEGAEATTLMVTPADSLIVADFVKASGEARERDLGAGKTLVRAVEIYISPFGQLKVVPNRFLKKYNATPSPDVVGEALLIDPDMIELKWLRPWQKTMLAKSGDNTRYQILGELTFCHKNYKGTGRITDLNPAA